METNKATVPPKKRATLTEKTITLEEQLNSLERRLDMLQSKLDLLLSMDHGDSTEEYDLSTDEEMPDSDDDFVE